VHSFSTVTRDDGRFVIDNVPSGVAYYVVATHSPEHSAAAYKRANSADGWTPLKLTAGQRITDLRIVLGRSGSISGRIVGLEGKAVPRITVTALRVGYRDDQRIMEPAGMLFR
jgi:hypothetical protein